MRVCWAVSVFFGNADETECEPCHLCSGHHRGQSHLNCPEEFLCTDALVEQIVAVLKIVIPISVLHVTSC